MKTTRRAQSLLSALLPILLLAFLQPAPTRAVEIFTSPDATPLEGFAAREVRRYTWLASGELLPLRTATRLPYTDDCLVVGRVESTLVRTLLGNPPASGSDDHRLLTLHAQGRKVLVLAGSTEVSTLYAAYRWAERLGIRFYLHGDVIPDGRRPLVLPDLDESRRPLFALRGIQPFHDFPEGPDWWNRDDYRAVISQLPKLGMNFFALHTYPEGRPNAEPTVWIGPRRDHGPSGEVKAAYPASYQNTSRGNWGYRAKPTSAFSHGTAALFDRDAFGPEIMNDLCPEPTQDADQRAVFDRTAALLRDAFTHARRRGVKTCVGTETPLVIPRAVADRLRASGLDPHLPAIVQQLYEGIFSRAAAAYPLDFYWFWTPEGWTWEGTRDDQVRSTLSDLAAAIAAHSAVEAPFRLATCGWVLGPAQDRALFDKVLPKSVAVSCINREVGRTPVEPGFRDVQGRGKWAIPWLEDDPALTAVQLWAGRMRRDAADAREYGCDGLLGIHWRTRVLGPAVAALAQAAWTQEPWLADLQRRRALPAEPPDGFVIGGQSASFPGHEILDTAEDAVYRTVRYNLEAYRLPLPNGSARVTLRFCEPHYREAGKRVFDVSLQGQTVIQNLDLFARVGADRALDLVFENVPVTNRLLEIRFIPRTEFPSIAALSVECGDVQRHLDCGGPGAGRYTADLPTQPSPRDAFADTTDFYHDWARAEFGPSIADDAATLFARIDGHLPRPSDWVDGPGGLKPDPRAWSVVRHDYDFVEAFAALEPRVQGPSQSARFRWWLDSFRYLRAMGELNCAWAVFQQRLVPARPAGSAGPAPASAEALLAARKEVLRCTTEVYRHLLPTLGNPGELGTLANWEQHLLPDVIGQYDATLADRIGGPLPPELSLPSRYEGPARLIVPTAPTSLPRGERLSIRLLVLAPDSPRHLAVFHRPLGQGTFASQAASRVAREVYTATLPPRDPDDGDFEWYAELTDASGTTVRWPPSAPAVGHSVVIEPAW